MIRPRTFPLFRRLTRFGGQDAVFDIMLLVGPPLIVSIAFVGRTVVTSALAGGYILFFLGYLLYKGLSYR